MGQEQIDARCACTGQMNRIGRPYVCGGTQLRKQFRGATIEREHLDASAIKQLSHVCCECRVLVLQWPHQNLTQTEITRTEMIAPREHRLQDELNSRGVCKMALEPVDKDHRAQ